MKTRRRARPTKRRNARKRPSARKKKAPKSFKKTRVAGAGGFYRPFDPTRSTVILDLDETLVSTISSKNSNADVLPSQLPVHSEWFVAPNPNNQSIWVVFVRPYTYNLLIHCLHHFNVAIWSSAEHEYVKSVVEHLMSYCERDVKELSFVWGRSEKNYQFVDAFTLENIPDAFGQKNRDNHKYLQNVFNRFPKCKQSSTLLFDNRPNYRLFNSTKNIVHVPPYHHINHHDSILRHFIDIISSKNSSKHAYNHGADQMLSVLIKELAVHKGKNISLSVDDFEKFEKMSSTNDNTLYTDGSVRDTTQNAFHIDESLLTRGRRLIIADPLSNKKLPASVISTNAKKTTVKVRVVDNCYEKNTFGNVVDTNTPQKETKDLKISNRTIPIQAILGLYDYWKFIYKFNVPYQLIESNL